MSRKNNLTLQRNGKKDGLVKYICNCCHVLMPPTLLELNNHLFYISISVGLPPIVSCLALFIIFIFLSNSFLMLNTVVQFNILNYKQHSLI